MAEEEPPAEEHGGRLLTEAELEDEDDKEVYINARDGLPNVSPEAARLAREELSPDLLDELPKSLIVTNVPAEVFDDEETKGQLEALFREVSPTVDFQWLRSFKRLRVNYADTASAADARVRLHRLSFQDAKLGCYFAQPVTPASSANLRPPAPFKQFLISPPSSPPLGWEPRPEGEPIVNRELVAALQQLVPGDMRELLPSRAGQPAIIVHAVAVKTDEQ